MSLSLFFYFPLSCEHECQSDKDCGERERCSINHKNITSTSSSVWECIPDACLKPVEQPNTLHLDFDPVEGVGIGRAAKIQCRDYYAFPPTTLYPLPTKTLTVICEDLPDVASGLTRPQYVLEDGVPIPPCIPGGEKDTAISYTISWLLKSRQFSSEDLFADFSICLYKISIHLSYFWLVN